MIRRQVFWLQPTCFPHTRVPAWYWLDSLRLRAVSPKFNTEEAAFVWLVRELNHMTPTRRRSCGT